MNHFRMTAKALIHDLIGAGRRPYKESWPPPNINGVVSTSQTREWKVCTSTSSALVAGSRVTNQPVRSVDWISRRSEVARISYNHVSQPATKRTASSTNLFGDVPESSVHHGINSVHQFLWSQTVDIRRIRVAATRMHIPSDFGQLHTRFLDRWTLGLGHKEGNQALLGAAKVVPSLSDFDVR